MNNVCPVSKNRLDENKARIIAFFVIVITGINLYFNNYYIAGVLALDFAVRAFSTGKLSLLKFFAVGVSKLFRLKVNPVNAAPKQFSAGMGMTFCLLIAVFQFTHYIIVAQCLGAMLIICAFLECAFRFCLGCKIYECFSVRYRF